MPASAIKGLYPFCIHKLQEQGRLEYDDLVTEYWPEFGQGGKSETTIRHLVSHWAGLEEKFSIDVYKATQEETIAYIETATSGSRPGTKGAYHSQTYMPLISSLVYKITGESIESFFRREIAGPIGIDAYLNVPTTESVRVADYIMPAMYSPALRRHGINVGLGEDSVWPPSRLRNERYMGLINGRGFARLMAMSSNGGILDGVRLFDKKTIQNWGEHQWSGTALFPGGGDRPMHANMGWLTPSAMLPFPVSDKAYMMSGAGGNIGLADPVRKLGFGYSLNRWHTENNGQTLGSRAISLLEAVYSCL
jgi:CubicO group peptidase (beta-lactamase class C family)|tara:strand:+ start:19290 stop:20210 length:921 start_codon:yes stop_codon:yes gene_type:complete